jgi:pseudaminic acid cytidylyltransferase
MTIAVLPARGGSRRIPRKNVKPFCGRPMIAWPLEAVHASGLFDRVIVSTDDEEVASVAESLGAECPFRRPADLSDDMTGTTDVIAHTIRWATDAGWAVGPVCCVYPTAALLRPGDLRRGLEALESRECSYAFSVTDFPAPIFRAFRVIEGGGVEMFFPEYFDTRSQDLPKAWHDAGQFYWGRAEAWLRGERIFGPRSVAVPLPRRRVQDIDEPEDWLLAEAKFTSLRAARDE